jgi:predicted transcriptional regulator
MTRLLCSALELQLRRAVLNYIKRNPGQRLYIIDAATVKSHHNWGAKYIVDRLEAEGKLYVKREHHGQPRYEDGSKVWPLYYAVG